MGLQRVKLTVELNDETVHNITITNASLVAWDRTRAKRQWPAVDVAPSLWQTFIAWHHMKAAGLITAEFQEFEETLCVVVTSDAELAEAEAQANGETYEPGEADLVPPTARTPEYDFASP